MITTLLFDLDGTLIGLDTDEFLQQYLQLVGQFVRDIMEPKAFTKHLVDATYTMIADTRPDLTNKDKFLEHFLTRINESAEPMLSLFDVFYRERYPELQRCAQPMPGVREVLDYAVENDYQLVVATNSVFPKTAVRERMRWVGIDHYPWAFVASYENMHYAKPQLKYYQEILAAIGKEPQECLMVGNDTLEDMIASKLGITTFLVEQYAIERPDKHYEPDYRGSFRDLLRLLQDLGSRRCVNEIRA